MTRSYGILPFNKYDNQTLQYPRKVIQNSFKSMRKLVVTYVQYDVGVTIKEFSIVLLRPFCHFEFLEKKQANNYYFAIITSQTFHIRVTGTIQSTIMFKL